MLQVTFDHEADRFNDVGKKVSRASMQQWTPRGRALAIVNPDKRVGEPVASVCSLVQLRCAGKFSGRREGSTQAGSRVKSHSLFGYYGVATPRRTTLAYDRQGWDQWISDRPPIALSDSGSSHDVYQLHSMQERWHPSTRSHVETGEAAGCSTSARWY